MQDYTAKGVILLASVISVFGLLSLFTSSNRPDLVATKTVENATRKPVVNAVTTQPSVVSPSPAPAANSIEERKPQTLAALAPANTTVRVPVEIAEPAYICGAATKKGTPCSRKVKGNVRCWQHAGQAAMLPPGQLRASR